MLEPVRYPHASGELCWKGGFRVVAIGYAPMHLLRPLRLIQDEGILGTLRLANNLLADKTARQRVMAMRRIFERYRQNLSAVYVIARKDL